MVKGLLSPDYIFESSWEVCNKVGGIYTVLSTRAKTLQDAMKDRIIFLGPDFKEASDKYFTADGKLFAEWQQQALSEGLVIRVGRWTVPGTPVAVLIDFTQYYKEKNDIYTWLWNHYQVDSLHGDYDEASMFSYAAAKVVESFYRCYLDETKKVVYHGNEWMTGLGLLYINKVLPQVATLFTTHATSIGRSICGNNKPLYDYMSGYNGDQMAEELNMQSKHSIEKTAAHQADAFTTVSEVTAAECRQLLEINPYVTPNAFEQNFVPKGEKYAQARAAARNKMLSVASALLGEKFADDTLIVATSGRNEFRNKGLDAFIDSINVLRNDLRGLHRRVIAFIMVPAWTEEACPELANALAEGKCERQANALTTHNLYNFGSDNVFQKMLSLGFTNLAEDNVKLIYVPCYLNGNDGIFNMSYYDLIPGFDLTMFASYYEPWGYTPLESIAFGVPTLTTDVAGFGQGIKDNFENETCGVNVIHRTDSNYSELVMTMADKVKEFYGKSESEISKLRAAAAKTSKCASWDNFIKYYLDVYSVAIQNSKKRKS